MSNAQTSGNEDRSLEQALTNKIIDDYFDNSPSWLRAILRMCFFSLAHLDGKPVFVVECPNYAVAKRLSRKTYPFRGLVYFLIDNFNGGDRTLFCYQEENHKIWRCFDTSTNSWRIINHLQTPKTPTE